MAGGAGAVEGPRSRHVCSGGARPDKVFPHWQGSPTDRVLSGPAWERAAWGH